MYSTRAYEVPALSEMILEVQFPQSETGSDTNGDVIIEPTEDFSDRYNLTMAACLADGRKQAGMVRVLNPTRATVSVRRGAVLGYAQPVSSELGISLGDEAEQGVHNSDAVRRIALENTHVSSHVVTENITNASRKATNMSHLPGLQESTWCAVEVPIHLKDTFEKCSSGRIQEEKESIAKLLVEYQDVFSRTEEDLGCTNLIEHGIDTGEAKPIKQPPRRVPIALSQEEKQAVDQLLKQDVIERSTSPWASPIVLVRKKNGKIRPCVDYRKLNDVTYKDAYPLPRIQDCLDAMAGASVFSTLDMTSGYYQVPVKADDKPKTAFVTKRGLFQFKTMPFGLSNAPATFQRLMELALSGLQWTTCLIYLDDVIIFASSFNEHLSRIQIILERFRKANLKLKPEKCQLFQGQVTFLGHVVSREGIRPDPSNLSKVGNWQVPTNVTEVRQFLGFVHTTGDL